MLLEFSVRTGVHFSSAVLVSNSIEFCKCRSAPCHCSPHRTRQTRGSSLLRLSNTSAQARALDCCCSSLPTPLRDWLLLLANSSPDRTPGHPWPPPLSLHARLSRPLWSLAVYQGARLVAADDKLHARPPGTNFRGSLFRTPDSANRVFDSSMNSY